MSQAVHLVGKPLPGSGLPEGKCLLCPGVSGRAVTLNACSSRFQNRFQSQANVGPLRCASAGASYVCKASSNNGYRRNPDFSRQNRHGFSRGRNRQNEDRDSFENLDDSDILSSKNGPYLSLSNSPKFQATAAPGPREKEIVELFRKVQAQLRERAAAKEEKKTESMQGQGKENETVDSLLKLLRKHSTEQAKRGNSSSNSKDYMYDRQVQNDQYNRGKNTHSLDSNSGVKDDASDSFASFTRPVSNFQRKSPVPRLKFQPIYSDEDTASLPSRKQTQNQVEAVPKSDLELELGPEAEDDEETESELETDEPELVQLLDGELGTKESLLDDDEEEEEKDEESGDEEPLEHEDLSAWKLSELRALAKSRGLKGYSKMKKRELVDLLSGSSVDP